MARIHEGCKKATKGDFLMIERMTGRLHVSTPDDEAVEYILDRLREEPDEDQLHDIRLMVSEAMENHRELYRSVMG